jgi:hypothetical protein
MVMDMGPCTGARIGSLGGVFLLVAMAGIAILSHAGTNVFSAESIRHGSWDWEPPICIHLHGKHCVDQYGDHVGVTDVCPETRTVRVDR